MPITLFDPENPQATFELLPEPSVYDIHGLQDPNKLPRLGFPKSNLVSSTDGASTYSVLTPEQKNERLREELIQQYRNVFQKLQPEHFDRYLRGEVLGMYGAPKNWFQVTRPFQQGTLINEDVWYRTFGENTGGLLDTFKMLWNDPKLSFIADRNNISEAARSVLQAQRAFAIAAQRASTGQIDPASYRTAYKAYQNRKQSLLNRINKVQNELTDMQERGFKNFDMDDYLTYKALRAYEGFLAAKARVPDLKDTDARAWVRAALRKQLLNNSENIRITNPEAALRRAEAGLQQYIMEAREKGRPILNPQSARAAPMSGWVSTDELIREKSRLDTMSLMPNWSYQ